MYIGVLRNFNHKNSITITRTLIVYTMNLKPLNAQGQHNTQRCYVVLFFLVETPTEGSIDTITSEELITLKKISESTYHESCPSLPLP